MAGRISFTFIGSIILIMVTAFCISGTVVSQEKNGQQIETKYYREMEKEYVSAVRSLLAQKGYQNSGVTMTEVVEADGSRSYTVTIHHKGIDALSDTGKQELLKECDTLLFPDESCNISHKFLEEDL